MQLLLGSGKNWKGKKRTKGILEIERKKLRKHLILPSSTISNSPHLFVFEFSEMRFSQLVMKIVVCHFREY